VLVLHAAWEPGPQPGGVGLAVWAEDPSPAGPPAARRRRVTDPAVHPFAVPAAVLEGLLGGRGGDAVRVLPTVGGAPGPSPELVRDAVPPTGSVTRTPWRVPCVRWDAPDAAALLAAGPPEGCTTGASWRHAAELAAFADDLAARGRVLPVVEPLDPVPDGVPTRGPTRTVRAAARWRPLVTGADAAWARALVLALPPVALHGAADVGGPDAVVAAVVDDLADAAVRRRLARRGGTPGAARLRGGTPALRGWLGALTGEGPAFDVGPDDLADLDRELRAWRADAAGGSARLRLQLVDPDGAVEGEGDGWQLRFALQAADEPSLVVPADQVWAQDGDGTGARALARHVPSPRQALLTELGRATRLFPPLTGALRTATPEALGLDTAQAHAFLTGAAPGLAAAGFGVDLPGWWGRPAGRLGARLRAGSPAQPGVVGGSAGLGRDALVDYRWEVALGDDVLTEEELRELAGVAEPLVRVRGRWVELDTRRLARGLKLMAERPTGTVSIAAVLGLLASIDEDVDGLPLIGVQADGWLGDLLSGAADERLTPVAAPEGFEGTLRPYQERGLAWLSFLDRAGLGGVLADDMGLGKTVQLLALFAQDPPLGAGRTAPTLLVCPMSLVGTWQREAAKFTPGLRVHVHHGGDRARGEDFEDAVRDVDLVVTTYAVAARDAAQLREIAWHRVVLDEAQAVKNAATRQSLAVRSLPARQRLAVTGTPVENRLADLWSVLDFANPGLLGTAHSFKQRFAVPVERHGDEDAARRLRTVTRPFVLRRVKTDRSIVQDLPEKFEVEVTCPLTREQAALYRAVVDDMLAKVEETDGMQRRGLVLATMTRLKQVCNHPAQLLRDGGSLSGRSGKLERVEQILEQVLASGERALLFTQFAEFGVMLRSHLSARFGREVLFLHGGLGRGDRDAAVTRFQSGDPGAPALFVLSLKAGGTGLTLTAANHVVHVDRWWNPAVEDQATDRAFRIGQTRDVQVRTLVCAGTLEERIAAVLRDKRGLAASVVGSGESWLADLSTEQLRELVTLDESAVAS